MEGKMKYNSATLITPHQNLCVFPSEICIHYIRGHGLDLFGYSFLCLCLVNLHTLSFSFGIPWWLSGKESTCQCRKRRFNPWVEKIPWRRKWQLTLVFLSGKSHGQGSLEIYSPQGRKESDMTEQLNGKHQSLFLKYLLSSSYQFNISGQVDSQV